MAAGARPRRSLARDARAAGCTELVTRREPVSALIAEIVRHSGRAFRFGRRRRRRCGLPGFPFRRGRTKRTCAGDFRGKETAHATGARDGYRDAVLARQFQIENKAVVGDQEPPRRAQQNVFFRLARHRLRPRKVVVLASPPVQTHRQTGTASHAHRRKACPRAGTRRENVTMAGVEWQVATTFAATENKDVLRVEIAVFKEAAPDAAQAELTGFLGRY